MEGTYDFNVEILARTIYGEARGESNDGRIAIANVVVNRVYAATDFGTSDRWGWSVAEVCLRQREFECWNEESEQRRTVIRAVIGDLAFFECWEIAHRACLGFLHDVTMGADHYWLAGKTPPWTHDAVPTVEIGRMLFYREMERHPVNDHIETDPADDTA